MLCLACKLILCNYSSLQFRNSLKRRIVSGQFEQFLHLQILHKTEKQYKHIINQWQVLYTEVRMIDHNERRLSWLVKLCLIFKALKNVINITRIL